MQHTKYNYFLHNVDLYTITSHGWIWDYPNNRIDAGTKSIEVLPQIHETDTNLFSGICSDVIGNYK